MTLRLHYLGFSYPDFYNAGYENSDSLASLAATGSNTAALEQEYGIDVQTSSVVTDALYTDSLPHLAATVKEAATLGQTVMVRPLIDFLSPSLDGSLVYQWRSYFNPTNPAAFFASYKAMIVAQATTAQQAGAKLFCVGAELDQLTGPAYLAQWSDIIAAVRSVFSGKLTYSANWNAALSPWQYGPTGLGVGTGNIATQISFWSQLDYVGIDQYAAISDAANPTMQNLLDGWEKAPTDPIVSALTGGKSLISYYESVSATIGKPLIFTEMGYEDATDAASQPFTTSTNVVDQALQANLYQAFVTAWSQQGDASLAGVYLWNWDPYAAIADPVNGPNFSPQSNPAALAVFKAAAATMIAGPAAGDFTGDGWSDLLLQNADGAIVIQPQYNLAVTGGAFVGNPGPTWHVVASADLNGDGTPDLLLQNNDGRIVDYLMHGTAINTGALLGAPGSSWHVRGAADFNGDGKADIVLQSDDGSIVVWTTDGSAVTAGDFVSDPGPSWHVEGVADFTGDGQPDILLQNTAGQLVIYTMSGTSIAATAAIGGPIPGWAVAGTGDTNGDGKAGILLHNDNGANVLWTTDGSAVTGTVSLGNPGAAWSGAVGGLDLNGDGSADLVVQNTDSTMVGFTLDTAGAITAGAVLGVPGAGWHAIGNVPILFIDGTGANANLAGSPGPDQFDLTSFTPGLHQISAFDPAQDSVALSAARFPTLGAMAPHEAPYAGGTFIDLGNSSAVLIQGIAPGQLGPANFVLR